MSAVLIGLALALSASLAQGAGYLCQHLNAAERPPVSARRPLRTLSSMLRSPGGGSGSSWERRASSCICRRSRWHRSPWSRRSSPAAWRS